MLISLSAGHCKQLNSPADNSFIKIVQLVIKVPNLCEH